MDNRLFQSTLPRGERRFSSQHVSTPKFISIHAPARGATITHDTLFLFFVDFNPRSREGSDRSDYITADVRINFNPRSREGSDKKRFIAYNAFCGYFNPRSREGSDKMNSRVVFVCMHFNPRSREGSDGKRIRDLRKSLDFNPRSREGSDHWLETIHHYFFISIHAPARGATILGC